MLGCGAGAFAWFTLSPFFGAVPAIVLLTGLMVATGLFCIARRTVNAFGGPGEGAPGDRATAVDVALAVVLVAQVAALFAAASHTQLGWDGMFNFEMKARLAFEHTPSGQLPRGYFADASRTWSHPHYPLLVPFTEFWIYSWLGRVDQTAVKVIFPMFYLSLAGAFAGAVRRIAGRRGAMLGVIALGLLPPLTLLPGAASGYADVPLAAGLAGAVLFALIGLTSGNRDTIVLGAALSAAVVWTKSEGVMLAAAIAVAGVAIGRGRAVILVWLPAAAAIPWLAFQHIYGQPGADFRPVAPLLLVAKLPEIVAMFARELLRPGHWALIWPVFFLTTAAMAFRRSSAADRFLAAAVVIPLSVYPLVYAFSAWPDVRDHMGSSLPRIMVPLAPLALVFIIRRLHVEPPMEAG
jgi:hypothetical protein